MNATLRTVTDALTDVRDKISGMILFILQKISEGNQDLSDQLVSGLKMLAACYPGIEGTYLHDQAVVIYGRKPWQCDNVLILDALLDLADTVAPYPESLDCIFHVAERTVKILAESRVRGSIAFPQGVRLLDRANKIGTEYLRHTTRAQVEEERQFLPVIDKWMRHDSAVIREIAKEVDRNYK